MTKRIILITSIYLGLMSCGSGREDKQIIIKPEPMAIDEIVNSTAINKNGRRLEMSFNNTKNIAQIEWEGQKIELQGQPVASGIWYKNNQYELRGKGEQINLSKDSQLVFQSVKAIVYGEKHLFVAADTKDCSTGTMHKECLQVKYEREDPGWELFYEPIAGFKYEKGYEYELIVLDERMDAPPADGSSIHYKLIKEVSKVKKS